MRLARTQRGIDVTVTAAEPGAETEIRELAARHARQGRISDAEPHSGYHGGPGTIGHCPIIHDRTRISVTLVPGGATLHVVALAPDHVRSLQEQTAQRLAALPRWLPRAAR